MDEEFRKRRAITVRAMAEKADPFIKRRLLDLASRYEKPQPQPTPLPLVDIKDDDSIKDGDPSLSP